MTLKLIATAGATEIQEDAHIIPTGGGTYTIPSTLQDFVFINGALVILDGQKFDAHGEATCRASSALLYINGRAVVRHNDYIDHHHSNTGVIVGNQSFCYSE